MRLSTVRSENPSIGPANVIIDLPYAVVCDSLNPFPNSDLRVEFEEIIDFRFSIARVSERSTS